MIYTRTIAIALGALLAGTGLKAQECIRGNCLRGFGTYAYADKSRYTGEFRGGLREGKGVYYYANGNKYLGDWLRDERNGEGKMEYANGDHYSGRFVENRLEGIGTMQFASGDRYIGQWLDNQPSGRGTYYFTSGDRYEGAFAEARFSGLGTMFYRNGSRFSGQWRDGLRNGYGTLSGPDGTRTHGYWEADRLTQTLAEDPLASVEAQWSAEPTVMPDVPESTSKPAADDEVLVDAYFNNLFGEGEVAPTQPETGSTAEIGRYFGADVPGPPGETTPAIEPERHLGHDVKPAPPSATETPHPLAEGIPSTANEQLPMLDPEPPAPPLKESELPDCNKVHCDRVKGRFLYADGSRWVGNFENGEPSGVGICYYGNGDRYEGHWKHHAPDGEGTMYFASGLVYAAIWERGQAVREISRRQEFTFGPGIPVEKTREVKIWAVIVGVARYEHMPVLKYSDDDAYKIYAFLKSPEGGALRDDQVRILIDEDATRKGMLDAINQVFMRADENDVVMLYYSGHGLEGTFLPSDYDGYRNAVTHDEVKALLDQCRAKSKICYIDACHSGSLLARKSPYASSLLFFYDALQRSSGGAAFLMSSKDKEYSLEDGGLRQGVFSHFLIRGLKGAADYDADRTITLRELFEYVYRNVRTYTGHVQTPMIAGEYDEQMPVGFVRND